MILVKFYCVYKHQGLIPGRRYAARPSPDMNADGTGQRNLTNNPAADFMPTCLPDVKKIAFVSYRDWNEEIYVMNADGTEQKNLTNNPASDENPSWSPFLPLENKIMEDKK